MEGDEYLGIIVIVLVILGIWFVFGGEKEGLIDVSDCRAEYELEDKLRHRIFNEFTCSYTKTEDGKVMSGFCARAKTKWISGECTSSYYYSKNPFKTCSEEYPWLGSDGQCWSGSNPKEVWNTVYAGPEK